MGVGFLSDSAFATGRPSVVRRVLEADEYELRSGVKAPGGDKGHSRVKLDPWRSI